MRLVALGTLPQAPLFSSRLDATIRLLQFGGDSARGYDSHPRKGAQEAAVGGSISPATGEIGSSSWEPSHDCLVPRGELVLDPRLLERFCSATEGLGGGARRRGQGQHYCELPSERGRAARRVFGEFCAAIGAFAYLAPQAWLRGFRSVPGAEPEAGPWAGLGQGQGVEVDTEEKSVSPASAGVGGRQEGTGLREVKLVPARSQVPCGSCGPPLFFFPLRPRLRGFRSAAGARRGRGLGGATSGQQQEDGIELAARPWASSRPPEDKNKEEERKENARRGYRRPTPGTQSHCFFCRGARDPVKARLPERWHLSPPPRLSAVRNSAWLVFQSDFRSLIFFFFNPDLRPPGSITKTVREAASVSESGPFGFRSPGIPPPRSK